MSEYGVTCYMKGTLERRVQVRLQNKNKKHSEFKFYTNRKQHT